MEDSKERKYWDINDDVIVYYLSKLHLSSNDFIAAINEERRKAGLDDIHSSTIDRARKRGRCSGETYNQMLSALCTEYDIAVKNGKVDLSGIARPVSLQAKTQGTSA